MGYKKIDLAKFNIQGNFSNTLDAYQEEYLKILNGSHQLVTETSISKSETTNFQKITLTDITDFLGDFLFEPKYDNPLLMIKKMI